MRKMLFASLNIIKVAQRLLDQIKKTKLFHKVIPWGNQGAGNHKLKQNFIPCFLNLQISCFFFLIIF